MRQKSRRAVPGKSNSEDFEFKFANKPRTAQGHRAGSQPHGDSSKRPTGVAETAVRKDAPLPSQDIGRRYPQQFAWEPVRDPKPQPSGKRLLGGFYGNTDAQWEEGSSRKGTCGCGGRRGCGQGPLARVGVVGGVLGSFLVGGGCGSMDVG